ncbi:MAG: DUF2490 domain-containing protein [Nitrosomonas sp.]|nr:DUF2490 domain-containing protein [Nitrosomonas sp.]
MIKKTKALVLFIVMSLFIAKNASAEAIVDDFQVWGNITATGNFGAINPNNPDLKRFRWWMEGQGRFGNNASQFTQSLIRPGLGYAITDKMVAWVGYAWAPTAEPLARNPFNEHRLWEQVTWADNFPFGRLTLRSRFEQRFFDHDIPIPGPNPVGHRFRQLVKLAVPLTAIHPNLLFIIQDELFINMTTMHDGFVSRGFDQNRGFVGLGYKLTQYATLELGYMNQLINRPHSARPDQMMHNLSVNLLMNF